MAVGANNFKVQFRWHGLSGDPKHIRTSFDRSFRATDKVEIWRDILRGWLKTNLTIPSPVDYESVLRNSTSPQTSLKWETSLGTSVSVISKLRRSKERKSLALTCWQSPMRTASQFEYTVSSVTLKDSALIVPWYQPLASDKPLAPNDKLIRGHVDGKERSILKYPDNRYRDSAYSKVFTTQE
ncbi:hypothetical protein FRC18_009919 [Serendipita sp. 400]|nr:hypothetical protein FRC18_009919 [Serendipita sp. 400]